MQSEEYYSVTDEKYPYEHVPIPYPSAISVCLELLKQEYKILGGGGSQARFTFTFIATLCLR